MSRLSIAAPPNLANTARSRAAIRPSKRLILCEDGSWLNSDNGSLKGALAIPSNVTRLSRAIKPHSSEGIPQVVYYHFGVGAGGGLVNRIAGIAGGGLDEIVREGYEFIATNYSPGDEIFIFGFSRDVGARVLGPLADSAALRFEGAFSARSIAGLIDEVGILTKDGLPFLAEIYRDVKHQHDQDYKPKHPDIPFPNKPSFQSPEYREELRRRRLTRLSVPIKVVGVWETVGSLGTPKLGWLTRLGLQSSKMKHLSFYDTALSDCIEYAFQALALDERRYSFQPTLWEKLEGNTTRLRQVWFPGAHSNVGGGYDDQQIATITFAWMVAQCEEFIDFDLDYSVDLWDDCEQYYEKTDQKVRPWSFGKIYDGMAGVYALGGAATRKPGRYCAVDPATGQETGEPLIDTREYIHPSVRARIKLKGPGIKDRGSYNCKSLRDWKLVIENEEGAKGPRIYWRARDRPEDGFVRELPEAPLKALERDILDFDPDTRQYVMRPSGMRQRRSVRNSSRGVSSNDR